MEGVILVADSKKIRPVLAADILRFESKGAYTAVFTRSGQSHLCSRHLKAVIRDLDTSVFIRIHKSHVVNVREVAFYEKGRGGNVVMSDGSNIPVGRRKKTNFLKRLKSSKAPVLA
jgi:two-component system, LytTR family, response regulator